MSDLDAAPEFAALLAEYADESRMPGITPPAIKMDMYKGLEAAGMLHVIASWSDGELVGFILVLTPVFPHYSKPISTIESFFVAKKNRKAGAGLRLLRAAEVYAKSIGSPGLLVSAPAGGALDAVLPKTDYQHTNNTYFKAFA